eukprot:m51a1_g1823 hypothetical protein (795) ;mRNA; f:505398-510498
MHTPAPLLLALSLLLARCEASRPHFRRDILGSMPVADPANPNHYEYSSDPLKRSPEETPSPLSPLTLEYSFDLKSGVHSADLEHSIVDLSCSSLDHIVIEVGDNKAVRSWGPQFVLIASAGWGCVEGQLSRRVVGLEWASEHTAHAATTVVPVSEVVANTSMHLVIENQEPLHDESENAEKRKPRNDPDVTGLEVVLRFKDNIARVLREYPDVLRASGIVNEVAHAIYVNSTDIIVAVAPDPEHLTIAFTRDTAMPDMQRLISQANYRDSILWDGVLMAKLLPYFIGYAIDVRSCAHNVDDEPSIVGLRCSSLDHVDVEVADDAVLRSWGPQFVLLASPAWGCVEGALRRHVVGVEWTSQRMARLKTTRASSEDELSNATIHVVIGGVTPTVEILKNTCLDACTTSEQKQTIRCLLCEAGVQTRSTVECHNCWSHTTLNQANLTIEWPLKDMAKHQKTVSVATTSEYHFGEVAFWMDAPGTALLVKEGISSSTFFENVSITEDLYIPITVTMTTNLIVDATLVTTPIFNSSVSYSIRSGQYGGSARIGVTTSGVVRMTHKYKRDSPSMTSTATWVQGALTPSVTGKATGRASVRVLMEQMYDIHIGNYSVIGSKVVSTTFGSTAFELQPPFGPMAGGKHGPCDKRHLLRLEGSHTVSTTAGRTLVLAAKGISKQGWWPKLIGRVATDAGCWRRSSGMTEVVLQFKDKVADVIKLRDDVLRSGIVYEVARAVKVNTFDIIANIARDPKSISITFILEENGPQTGERLALQAKYWDSVLWKGRLLSQLRSKSHKYG